MDSGTRATRFTWHPGSIFPYASLWHTILRVAALNRLWSADMPDWPTRPTPTGKKRLTLHPLHNDFALIDTDALAAALGENPSVFRWSHFGSLAPWLRNIVTPGFRLCAACIAHGYHSALFSLRLLDTCPIHGEPLADHCDCGRPFFNKIDPRDFRRDGYCACFRQRFFTRESCRKPALDTDLTCALSPIADWLDKVSQIVRPSNWRGGHHSADDPNGLVALFEWSMSLALAYPECFLKPVIARPRHLAHSTSGRLLERMVPPKNLIDTHATYSYWQDNPATWTYRALSRHLRRHVFVRAEGLGVQLLCPDGRFQRAATPDADDTPRWALAEILWARHLEPHVHQRRWPYRKPAGFNVQSTFSNIGMGLNVDTLAVASFALNQATRCWLQYQAAGAAMLMLWQTAFERAQEILQDRSSAQAAHHTMDIVCVMDWSALVQTDGHVQFVGLSSEGHCFARPARPDKHARVARWRKARECAEAAVFQQCTGVCLTWTEREGWHVVQADQPQSGQWQRHKLLGLDGPKPSFWLFTHAGLFVVRLCTIRLQVRGSSAARAIAALRRCLKQYLQSYAHTGELAQKD